MRINNYLERIVSQPISWVLYIVIINLVCLSPNISSSLPKSSASNAITFLFGLAPSGVCLARYITISAVRFYRTISPLQLNCGIFSVALSVSSHFPGVTWHSTLWSPDFPLCDNKAITQPTQLNNLI
tara:strand:- start:411 stop:791 length:381 start_codon:yes stop_codon:yes gene_type:complete